MNEETSEFKIKLLLFLLSNNASKEEVVGGLSHAIAMAGIAFEEVGELDFESFKKDIVKKMDLSFEKHKEQEKQVKRQYEKFNRRST